MGDLPYPDSVSSRIKSKVYPYKKRSGNNDPLKRLDAAFNEFDSGDESPDYQSFAHAFKYRSWQNPDDLALEYLEDGEVSGTSYTFFQLFKQSVAVAEKLQKKLKFQDRVLLFYPPGPEFVTAFLGCLLAGVIAVPAYPPKKNRNTNRLEAIIRDCGAEAILTTLSSLNKMKSNFSEVSLIQGLKWLATDDTDESMNVNFSLDQLKREHVAFIQYTSGSTGEPKGVIVNHRNLLHNSERIREVFLNYGVNRVVSWLPAFHDMGLIFGILQPVFSGWPFTLMAPNAFLIKPLRWLQAISKGGNVAAAGPDFAYRLCAEKISNDEISGLDLSGWKLAVDGAEPVRAETVSSFHSRFRSCGFTKRAFCPGYGMAEYTLYATAMRKDEEIPIIEIDPKIYQEQQKINLKSGTGHFLVACGQILYTAEVKIVDCEKQILCTEDSVGEIWLSSDSIAQGYWGKEKLSEEIFEAFTRDTGEGPFLRTGDLGFIHDGYLYISGRLKDLIIINGVNYYPQDLEKCVEESSESIQKGCCAAFAIQHQNTEKWVMVCELERKPKVDLNLLRMQVLEDLQKTWGIQPWELVFIRYGSSHKTSSGKIQRQSTKKAWESKKLFVIENGNREKEIISNSISETNLKMKFLREMAGKILQRELKEKELGQPVYHLGLNSLEWMSLLGAYQKKFSLNVLEQQQDDELTLQQLANLNSVEIRTEDVKVFRKPEISLFPMQQSFAGADEQQAASVIVFSLFVNNLDSVRLKVILENVCSSFVPFGLKSEDVLQTGNTGWKIETTDRPLETQALLKIPVGGTSDLNAVFFINETLDNKIGIQAVINHLWVDGYSVQLLLKQIESGIKGTVLEMSGLDAVCDAVARRHAQRIEKRELHKEYWLKCIPEWQAFGELPSVVQPESGQTGFNVYRQHIPKDLVLQLENFSRKQGISLFALLYTCHIRLWSHWTRCDQLTFNTSVLNRDSADLKQMQATFCFADIQPLRIDQLQQRSLLSTAREVARQLREMRRYDAFSAIEISRELASRNREVPQSLSPVIMTSASFEGTSLFELDLLGLKAPGTWLDLMHIENQNIHYLFWNYDQAVLGKSFIRKLAAQFLTVCRQLIDEQKNQGALPDLCSKAELRKIWNLNKDYQPFETQGNLIRVFVEQVRRTPDRTALSFGPEELSYVQLNKSSDQLAARLKKHGSAVGTIVALHVPRDMQIVIGILAILKTGAAYLPMDPVYPKSRLNYMLRDSQASILLTDESLLEDLETENVAVVVLKDVLAECPDTIEDFESDATPLDPAYVIYTSGSTGQPKGVIIRHHEVLRLFSATRQWYGFNDRDRWPLFHSYSFDVSVWEIWGALLHGGQLIVVSQQQSRNVLEFYNLLVREQITVLNQTPSAFRQLVDAEKTLSDSQLVKNLRFVIFAGEALEFASLKPWIRRHGDQNPQLINKYGITETTVHSTYRRIRSQDIEDSRPSLIGIPIPDLTMHILDQNLKPVPPGVTGEIYIGGAGLGLGYLNRAELTQQRYLPDPFNMNLEKRIYKSGDLARLLPDGEVEYLGRSDFQIQIRGFRVELGEIQERIARHPGIRMNAVVAHEVVKGELQIVAYVIADEMLDEKTLRMSLLQQMPEYMIPGCFIQLEELPLTENGKLDRRKLPDPAAYFASKSAGVNTAEFTETEEKLASIWEKHLKRPVDARDAHFFEMGGSFDYCHPRLCGNKC